VVWRYPQAPWNNYYLSCTIIQAFSLGTFACSLGTITLGYLGYLACPGLPAASVRLILLITFEPKAV